jgi:hypothetical protein
MTNRWFRLAIALSFFCLVAVSAISAQEIATGHAIVTATAKSNEAQVAVPQSSITVLLGRKSQDVSGWAPLRGPRGRLQLAILLDNSTRASMSLQLDDLRKFILALPPTAQVAVGYMQNGMPNLVQPFTSDHAAAANSLRIPLGISGINGSPYFCLQDLIKHWPQVDPGVRREVLMVTDGTDRYSGRSFNPEDPYVQAAINDAQKAGVVVYSIYYKGVGRYDRTNMATDSGQNYLIQVSGDTGGQAYYQGFGDPVSFAPFLDDLQRKLENQYELSFAASPKKGLQPMKVKTNQPNVKLQAPAQVLLVNHPTE